MPLTAKTGVVTRHSDLDTAFDGFSRAEFNLPAAEDVDRGGQKSKNTHGVKLNQRHRDQTLTPGEPVFATMCIKTHLVSRI
jgi:hypothetical protein